ncbi:hypothetical protein, partial [Escherichia coli]|uniref:hypothetical protein n=1 Tax=Escherichia coli TaxID=562 RepID=UPI001AA14B16
MAQVANAATNITLEEKASGIARSDNNKKRTRVWTQADHRGDNRNVRTKPNDNLKGVAQPIVCRHCRKSHRSDACF